MTTQEKFKAVEEAAKQITVDLAKAVCRCRDGEASVPDTVEKVQRWRRRFESIKDDADRELQGLGGLVDPILDICDRAEEELAKLRN